MQPEELMSKDYVLYKNEIYQVAGITEPKFHCGCVTLFTPFDKIKIISEGCFSYVEGIFLTKEILEKSGFETDDRHPEFFYLHLEKEKNNEEWTIGIEIVDDASYVTIKHYINEHSQGIMLNFKIYFVHQLQHLFRMCNIEKEIICQQD